jgi:hypothetical protein
VTSSEAPLDPVLDEQVRSRPNQRVPVVVVFNDPCSPEELEELGLFAGSPGPSSIAYGELDGPAVRALADRGDVASISSMPVLPARPAEDQPARSPGSGKIDSNLAMQLHLQPGAPLLVIVIFSRPPGPDTMDDLGLAPAGPTMATGTLDPEAILRLAERPDVVRLSWSPPPRLLNLD